MDNFCADPYPKYLIGLAFFLNDPRRLSSGLSPIQENAKMWAGPRPKDAAFARVEPPQRRHSLALASLGVEAGSALRKSRQRAQVHSKRIYLRTASDFLAVVL